MNVFFVDWKPSAYVIYGDWKNCTLIVVVHAFCVFRAFFFVCFIYGDLLIRLAAWLRSAHCLRDPRFDSWLCRGIFVSNGVENYTRICADWMFMSFVFILSCALFRGSSWILLIIDHRRPYDWVHLLCVIYTNSLYYRALICKSYAAVEGKPNKRKKYRSYVSKLDRWHIIGNAKQISYKVQNHRLHQNVICTRLRYIVYKTNEITKRNTDKSRS